MIPEQKVLRKYVIDNLDRYWLRGSEYIANLPIPHSDVQSNHSGKCVVEEVALPEWAMQWGVNGNIIVPSWAIQSGITPSWQRTDWFSVIFWLMNGLMERKYEQDYGPIHSYSYKLSDFEPILWEYAWVNRIALFLRAWAASFFPEDEKKIFGELPKGQIFVTHDVDAVSKTFPIRIKQTTFQLFNTFRLVYKGNYAEARKRFYQALKFLISVNNYWCFDDLLRMEKEYDVIGCFLFYGGMCRKKTTLNNYLIDPGYDAKDKNVVKLMQLLMDNKHFLGLHQSADTWNQPDVMKREKQYVESAIGKNIGMCRQHWLRFSWEHTWKTQEQTGLTLDMTLGFNDRSGFRNATALRWNPWDFTCGQSLKIQSLPMVIMDSHFYDYYVGNENDKWTHMERILNEIHYVGGEASVIWHPHTLSGDYNWYEGFEKLLSFVRKEGAREI